jgi:hypothetical protein
MSGRVASRTVTFQSPRAGWLALLAVVSLAAAAQAQVPQPYVPNVTQRGLVSRYTPVIPREPADPKRDSFLGTRYQDEHDNAHYLLRPNNSWLNGGMYGKPLCAQCTAAVYPNFMGSPANAITEECRGDHPATGRWVRNLINPFKPVGMYYDRGVYVPIYDFDYPVPGPGPFPWPHFLRQCTGG